MDSNKSSAPLETLGDTTSLIAHLQLFYEDTRRLLDLCHQNIYSHNERLGVGLLGELERSVIQCSNIISAAEAFIPTQVPDALGLGVQRDYHKAIERMLEQYEIMSRIMVASQARRQKMGFAGTSANGDAGEDLCQNGPAGMNSYHGEGPSSPVEETESGGNHHTQMAPDVPLIVVEPPSDPNLELANLDGAADANESVNPERLSVPNPRPRRPRQSDNAGINVGNIIFDMEGSRNAAESSNRRFIRSARVTNNASNSRALSDGKSSYRVLRRRS